MSSGVDSTLLDQAQKAGNPDSVMGAYISSALKNLHTALPGIIASVNGQVATVQPAIQRIFTERGPVALPVCLDVLMYFPTGGGFTVTFPVQQGDECLLVFSERCIDFWYENGGVQPPAEYRMHDLSDAFAFVGFNSKPNFLSNIQTDGMELRNEDRSTYLKLTNGTIFIKGDIVHEGNTEQTGNLNRTGTSTTSGLITGAGGMTVNGGTGVTMDGDITHTGTLTSNGKNIGSDHAHSGVTPGGGNSGGPV